MSHPPSPKQSFCPLCQSVDKGFAPLPAFYAIQARKHGYPHFGKQEMTPLDTYSCQTCYALDRERLYTLWINEQIIAGELHENSRILHFAPEMSLSIYMRALGIFKDYKTSDPAAPGTDYQYDLMRIDRPDESLDFFICSHVLEHVPDDRLAVQELYRITAKGGAGILMAPIIVGLDSTYENPLATTPEERWRHFGQNDHLRLYARLDYIRLLESPGFTVQTLTWRHFGASTIKLLGLKPTSTLYIVRK